MCGVCGVRMDIGEQHGTPKQRDQDKQASGQSSKTTVDYPLARSQSQQLERSMTQTCLRGVKPRQCTQLMECMGWPHFSGSMHARNNRSVRLTSQASRLRLQH